jgi:hypothetical protein
VEHRIELADAPPHVTVTTEGEADADGFAAFNEAIVSHPGFRPGMTILVDHSGLDASLLNADDIAAIAAHAKSLEAEFGDSAVAVVAPDAFTFGLARVSVREADFARLAPRTFASRSDAVDWLRDRGR